MEGVAERVDDDGDSMKRFCDEDCGLEEWPSRDMEECWREERRWEGARERGKEGGRESFREVFE